MYHTMDNGNWFAMFLVWAIVWIGILAVGVYIAARFDRHQNRHRRSSRT